MKHEDLTKTLDETRWMKKKEELWPLSCEQHVLFQEKNGNSLDLAAPESSDKLDNGSTVHGLARIDSR